MIYFRYLTGDAFLQTVIVFVERLVAIVAIIKTLAGDLEENTPVDLVVCGIALINEPFEGHLRLEIEVLARRLRTQDQARALRELFASIADCIAAEVWHRAALSMIQYNFL